MGVRAELLTIYDLDAVPPVNTLTAGDLTQSTIDDVKGGFETAVVALDDLIVKLSRLQAILTAAGDTTNATTVGDQITALS